MTNKFDCDVIFNVSEVKKRILYLYYIETWCMCERSRDLQHNTLSTLIFCDILRLQEGLQHGYLPPLVSQVPDWYEVETETNKTFWQKMTIDGIIRLPL